jgi:hypothetical protein
VEIFGNWEPRLPLGLSSLKFVGTTPTLKDYEKFVEKRKSILEEVEAKRTEELKKQLEARNKLNERRMKLLEQAKAKEKESGQRREREVNGVSPPAALIPPQNSAAQKPQQQQQQQQAPPKMVPPRVQQQIPQPAPQQQQAQPPPKQQQQVPAPVAAANNNNNTIIDKPLKGCKIVLSGFQDPERSDLRDMAIKLGAEYVQNWGTGCTHLITKFNRTPKVNDVVNSGFGFIVSDQWLIDCDNLGKKVLEGGKYAMAGGGPGRI